MLVYAGIGPGAGLWLVEFAFVAAGAGLALNTGPAVALAMGALPQNRTGLAAGLVNLARLVGITMGVAVLGSVLALVGGDAGSGPAFSAGLRVALLTGAMVELIGAAIVFVGIPPSTGTREGAAVAEEVCRA